ncbi:MAG TPA: methyltransferase domain-containing protein [Terriglobia bacterium]|nr:methyltransferase domain-containing protein [Terriglobia bacterium]
MPHEWWKDFFTGAALDLWRAAMSEDRTHAEADFILGLLSLAPQAKVLDVPCGEGRLTREFAAHGFEMTGVDLSRDFLKEAEAKADGRGLDIHWVRRDMRRLAWNAEFDGAFCFGNSFGYFTDEGNVSFLAAVSRALKPGARFVLDASSVVEVVLPILKPRTEVPVGDILFIEENRYDHVNGRLDTDYTFVRGDLAERKSGSHRIYTYRQMAGLLEAAGFEKLRTFGSIDKDPFALGSPQLLLVATKKPRARKSRKSRRAAVQHTRRTHRT